MAYTCENSTREAEPRQGEVGLSVLRSKKTVSCLGLVYLREMDSVWVAVSSGQLREQD